MKPFTRISAVVFAFVVLIHLYRFITKFQLSVFDHEIPLSLNVGGFIIAVIFCAGLWRESAK